MASRQRTAQLAARERGVCALCFKNPLFTPDRCWECTKTTGRGSYATAFGRCPRCGFHYRLTHAGKIRRHKRCV